MTRHANIVLLPKLTGTRQLIGDLEVIPPLFSPNGDGVKDRVEIRFVTLKVAAPEPKVKIFNLAGRLVAKLSPSTTGSLRSYIWNGADVQGTPTPPGIYLCRIDLGTQ